MFRWQKSYSVEIPKIDLQHRKVLALIKSLHATNSGRQSPSEMAGLFQELRDFTEIHFREEEALMLEHGYPGYEEQKRDHDAFVDLVSDHQRSFLRNRPAVSATLLSVLWDRFARHIEELDKKYITYFRERGVA